MQSPDANMPNQMPLSDPATLEPFVEQYAVVIGQQEAALHQHPAQAVANQELARVRESQRPWYVRRRCDLVAWGAITGMVIGYILRSR
jgi:hypothetical protein